MTTYALFPAERLNNDNGQEIETQIIARFSELVPGFENESGDFAESADGDLRRFMWWDGNDTQARWCDSSELEYIEVESVTHETVRTHGPYEDYLTTYVTDDGDVYLQESNNNHQSMVPRVTLKEA